MKNTYTKDVAVYLRSASTNPESINQQQLLIESYLEDHKGEVYGEVNTFIYADDGYSGISLDRPALTEMLEELKGGKFDMVIVADITRLSRDPAHLFRLLNEIDSNGAVIESCETGPFETADAVQPILLIERITEAVRASDRALRSAKAKAAYKKRKNQE